jgi:hypothetical protein
LPDRPGIIIRIPFELFFALIPNSIAKAVGKFCVMLALLLIENERLLTPRAAVWGFRGDRLNIAKLERRASNIGGLPGLETEWENKVPDGGENRERRE